MALPEAAPITPQHQAKSKEITRVVNHGGLECPVRGEKRDWTRFIVLGGEIDWGKIRKEGRKYLLKFIYVAILPLSRHAQLVSTPYAVWFQGLFGLV